MTSVNEPVLMNKDLNYISKTTQNIALSVTK